MRIPQPVKNELTSVLLHGVPPRRGSTVQPGVWFSSPFVAPSSAAQRTGCEAPSGLVPGDRSHRCGGELLREPGVSRFTPSIPQVAQEVPLRIQHAGLAEPIDMVLCRQMMKLQAVDLTTEPGGRLPF